MSTSITIPVPQVLESKKGIHLKPLIDGIEELTHQVVAKIEEIRKKKGDKGEQEVSIADMFDLQMSMNQLQQYSEMSTSVVSAINGSINSMARNVKG